MHGRDSLWCVPGQQAGRYLPASRPRIARRSTCWALPPVATGWDSPWCWPALMPCMAGIRSGACQVNRPGATCQRQRLAWPGFALVSVRSTGRALSAASTPCTAGEPGIATNGNRLGFAVVLASIDALQGRDSLWRVSSQQARRNLPASTPCMPGFALVSVRSTGQALPASVNALQGW